ncbi:hypothetical protein O3M35_006007 [Rhynocoris fuscipes]|uniref:ATP synthase F(0) complex subunit e, mitochondrial n=1 Tax=Rhynocoris fuscipes TaxID=488301 RepID=A0AAW1DBX7_9HEMI
MPTAFPPPVNVSPLIKLIRWTLLVSGIAYGTVWQKRHYAAELSLRDIRIQEKAARDKVLAEEKLRLNEVQLLSSRTLPNNPPRRLKRHWPRDHLSDEDSA